MQGFEKEHKRFWRQMILWAAGRDEEQKDDVWIRLVRRRFSPEERVPFTVGANSATGDVVEDAQFQVSVKAPDGAAQSVQVAQDEDGFSGSFPQTKTPGEYTISVTALRQGQEIGAAQTRFEVFDHDVELSNSAADHDLLRRLAAMTSSAGGRMLAREELPDLLQSLKDLPEQIAVEHETRWRLAGTAGDAWAFFLLMAGLLIAEWALRKKWALA
jgi:hypothetical protein